VISFLVFFYTQAARQLKYQREEYFQLKEQLVRAEAQVIRQGQTDLNQLQAEVLKVETYLPTREALMDWAQQSEPLARDRFGIHDFQIKVGASERNIPVVFQSSFPFEVQLLSVELQGTTTTRNTATFLESLKDPGIKLLCSLDAMELEASNPDQPQPVRLHLKWLVATSSTTPSLRQRALKESLKTPFLTQPDVPSTEPNRWPAETPSLEWGWREEPFLSPVQHPSAVRIPARTLSHFRLTGILWDKENPTCVINGATLKPGDQAAGYRLILITPSAVILQKREEEVVLSLRG